MGKLPELVDRRLRLLLGRGQEEGQLRGSVGFASRSSQPKVLRQGQDRCWAPSWTFRSRRRRSASPASTTRAGEAREVFELGEQLGLRRSFSTASRAAAPIGKDAHAVAAVARDLGVGWVTIMRAVADDGTRLVEDPARLDGVATLGLDETSFLKPPAGHRPGTSPAWSTWRLVGCWRWWPTAPGPRWVAGCMPGRTTGPGRHGRAGLLARLRQRPGRPAGSRQGGGHFHAIRLANAVVDQVRPSTQ